MNKLLPITFMAIISCYFPVAQGLELFNDNKSTLDFTGNLSVYYINSGDITEVNDGFSRYTFDMSHQMKDDWKALARLEWGVGLSGTEGQVFATNTGLTSTGPTTDSTWLRLGYVGVEHETYGRFTMGKQWGVSYDVSNVTDYFEVFGGQAQGTYHLGTDGGLSGVGRAEQAFQYKVNYQDFSFGAQYVVSDDVTLTDLENTGDDSSGVKFNNSYGVSVIYQTPFDIGLGFAYNKAKVNLVQSEANISSLLDLPEVDDKLISTHITYRPYGSQGLHVALVYTDMTNHELNDAGRVMNKANGIELMTTYRFENDISLIFGYTSLKDKSPVSTTGENNYHLNFYILSAKYHWDEYFYLFMESKIDDSTLIVQDSNQAENAIALGMMYAF